MGVVKTAQYLKLTLDFLEDAELADLLLVQDLDSDLVTCLLMEGHPHLSKCAISQVFRKSILPNTYFVYRHYFL